MDQFPYFMTRVPVELKRYCSNFVQNSMTYKWVNNLASHHTNKFTNIPQINTVEGTLECRTCLFFFSKPDLFILSTQKEHCNQVAGILFFPTDYITTPRLLTMWLCEKNLKFKYSLSITLHFELMDSVTRLDIKCQISFTVSFFA